MTQWLRSTRVLALLLAALLVASGCSAFSPRLASSQFKVRTDRKVVRVQAGGQAVFAVLVTGPSHKAVKLTVRGAPPGSIVQIRPNPVLSGTVSVVSVPTTTVTPVGTYYLKIKARQGHQTRTATVRLVVVRYVGYAITMSPPSVIVDTGGTAVYQVSLKRWLLPGPITLQLTGLPRNVTGTITPSPLGRGLNATVTVRVGAAAAPGSYRLTVIGRSRYIWTSASAYLVIAAHTTADFPISGATDLPVTPGGPSGAIDLALTNPNSSAMAVSDLAVAVEGTNTTGCGPENYTVVAYSGPASLSVPANTTKTLSQLGVPRAQWPQLQMINLPVNQDVCKGAMVQLHYSGLGNGS